MNQLIFLKPKRYTQNLHPKPLSRKDARPILALLLPLLISTSAWAKEVTLRFDYDQSLAVKAQVRNRVQNNPIFLKAVANLVALGVCAQTQCGDFPCKSIQDYRLYGDSPGTQGQDFPLLDDLYFESIVCSSEPPSIPQNLAALELKYVPWTGFTDPLTDHPLLLPMPNQEDSSESLPEASETDPSSSSRDTPREARKTALSQHTQFLIHTSSRLTQDIKEAAALLRHYRLRWKDFISFQLHRINETPANPLAIPRKQPSFSILESQPESKQFLLPPLEKVRAEIKKLRRQRSPELTTHSSYHQERLEFLYTLASYLRKRLRSIEGVSKASKDVPLAELAPRFLRHQTENLRAAQNYFMKNQLHKIRWYEVKIVGAVREQMTVLTAAKKKDMDAEVLALRMLEPERVNASLLKYLARHPRLR